MSALRSDRCFNKLDLFSFYYKSSESSLLKFFNVENLTVCLIENSYQDNSLGQPSVQKLDNDSNFYPNKRIIRLVFLWQTQFNKVKPQAKALLSEQRISLLTFCQRIRNTKGFRIKLRIPSLDISSKNVTSLKYFSFKIQMKMQTSLYLRITMNFIFRSS